MRSFRSFTVAIVLVASSCTESRPVEPRAEAQEAERPTPAAPANDHAGHHEEAAAGPQPTRTLEDGSRLFGSELAADGPVTALATIVSEPAPWAGKVVRCDGEIAQVCQRMGCWMELREGEHTVRVPMAGHSF